MSGASERANGRASGPVTPCVYSLIIRLTWRVELRQEVLHLQVLRAIGVDDPAYGRHEGPKDVFGEEREAAGFFFV